MGSPLALLCVDMQPAFLAAMHRGAEVSKRCAFALQASVGLGVPVVFTEQVPEKLGATAPELLQLAPDAKVFPKRTFSALADEPTLAWLPDNGTEHILLCGLETPVCVYQTALDALQLGWQVTVLSDAVAARRPDDATSCFAALRHAGVAVLPSETVFYAMLRETTHPFFREFTRLVKQHA